MNFINIRVIVNKLTINNDKRDEIYIKVHSEYEIGF